jgi:hypothetical protein
MLRQVRFLPSILFLSVAAACSSETSTVAGPRREADEALTAKAGSSTERRARYTVYLTMPGGEATGFRGDGRLADGTSSAGGPSVYEGGVCGVHGVIFWGGTNFGGDAVLDPDKDRAPHCAPARKLDIGPLGLVGPHVNFRAIMQLEVGQSRSHQLTMTPGLSNCYALRYGADVGSWVDVTRLSGSPDGEPGVWRAVSGGSHIAGCYSFNKGVYTYTGPDYYLPMHVLIEEVR